MKKFEAKAQLHLPNTTKHVLLSYDSPAMNLGLFISLWLTN